MKEKKACNVANMERTSWKTPGMPSAPNTPRCDPTKEILRRAGSIQNESAPPAYLLPMMRKQMEGYGAEMHARIQQQLNVPRRTKEGTSLEKLPHPIAITFISLSGRFSHGYGVTQAHQT